MIAGDTNGQTLVQLFNKTGLLESNATRTRHLSMCTSDDSPGCGIDITASKINKLVLNKVSHYLNFTLPAVTLLTGFPQSGKSMTKKSCHGKSAKNSQGNKKYSE